MGGFRFLPHSVTSDVAFEAFGETEAELFEQAAAATFSVMCDVKKVEPKEKRRISLEAETLEDLLFAFLDELIFLKDRDGILFSKFDVTIEHTALHATVFGERIDPQKHTLGVDVKAVTKHNFKLQQVGDHWRATVVLDI